MSRRIDIEDIDLKFDGCEDCANVRKCRICDDCDMGEYFEAVEPDGVDDLIVR